MSTTKKTSADQPTSTSLASALAAARQASEAAGVAVAAAQSAQATVAMERKKALAEVASAVGLSVDSILFISDEERASLVKKADAAKLPLETYLRGLFK